MPPSLAAHYILSLDSNHSEPCTEYIYEKLGRQITTVVSRRSTLHHSPISNFSLPPSLMLQSLLATLRCTLAESEPANTCPTSVLGSLFGFRWLSDRVHVSIARVDQFQAFIMRHTAIASGYPSSLPPSLTPFLCKGNPPTPPPEQPRRSFKTSPGRPAPPPLQGSRSLPRSSTESSGSA